MKKHILIATGLAVLSTSAFATKARLNALGEDGNEGSNFIKDTRNIFLNPAKVNQYKNYVVTEWGNGNATAESSEDDPHAEGGFFREAGSFAYGVYLGNATDDQNDNATKNTNYQLTENQVDLFIAGDAGIEWGARLHHGGGKDETGAFEKKNTTLGLGLGIGMGDLDASVNLDLTNKSTGGVSANDEFKADLGIHANASYAFGNTTAWVEFDKGGFTNTVSGAASEETGTDIEVGAGKTQDISSSTRVYYSLAFRKGKEETKPSGGTATETKTSSLPLMVAFEAEANSWLTLRGSVTQAILISNTEDNAGKKDSNNSTAVNAGATLNFGKLKVDGSIGGKRGSRNIGTLNTDELLGQVGVHFWW